MKIKHFLQFLTLILIVSFLSSCDGGGGGDDGGDAGNDNPFNLGPRYDRSSLELDPLGIPEMPRNLISTDKFTYVPDDEAPLTDNNISLPRTSGQLPWVLVPDVGGAVEIENYIYTFNLGILKSDSRGVDSGAVDALGEAGINRNGSWASVRPGVPINEDPTISDEGRIILQTALSGLGFISVITPNVVEAFGQPYSKLVQQDPPVFVNGSEVFIIEEKARQIPDIMLLGSRTITHTVTSTNEDILNSGVISGTFTLTDSYQNLYFYREEGFDTWEVRSGVQTIADIPIEVSQPQEIAPEVTGEFTIELGDGGFGIGDPNP